MRRDRRRPLAGALRALVILAATAPLAAVVPAGYAAATPTPTPSAPASAGPSASASAAASTAPSASTTASASARAAASAGASASATALPSSPRTPSLAISGLQTLEAKVRFYLTAHNLPYGTTLTKSALTVNADGEDLKATVEPIDGTSTDITGELRGAVLVLDTSESMAGAPLDAARDAAAAYAAALPADVALGLVTVSDQPTSVLAPTTDRARFDAAVNGVSAKGGTALYDGLHEADRMLATHTDYTERRIVVLSDGADTSSVAKAADVGTELDVDQVKMDVVAFGADAGGSAVTALATGTGGRLVAANDAAVLRTAFQDLAGTVSPPVLVTVDVPAYLGGRSVTMKVTVGATTVATASTAVTFRPDSRVTVPLTRSHPTRLPTWVLYGAVGTLAGGLLIGAFALVFTAMGRSRLRHRLRQLERFGGINRAAAAHHEEGNAFVRAALAMSDRAVKRRGDQSRIETALDQAAIDLRPEEWILLRIIAAVTGGTLLAFLLPWALGLIAGAAIGWIAPEAYRRQRASRRARKFADLLPEALQLVVGALRSGFSLAQAVDALVREGPDPVAGEFARATAEIRLGGELEDALDRVAARNNSRDLSWLVMAIRIQREVGGNLSEVMETAVNTMRERGQLNRHVRALSAEGRLSAYVLVALPVGVAAFMFVSRGEYLRPLYTQTIGLCMLAAAAIMIAAGAFWLSRLIKVKV
jgi:Flp pilus assembly protein TadB/Mg-chelatase subunit ChlD